MKLLVAMAAILVATAAVAGGQSWEFQVRSVKSKSSGAHIELVPIGESPYALPEQCAVLEVDVSYSWWRWVFSRGPNGPSGDTMKAAIDYLEAGKRSGKSIRFGEMGVGLVVENKATPCTAMSKGLSLVTEIDGGKAVYSFHDRP